MRRAGWLFAIAIAVVACGAGPGAQLAGPPDGDDAGGGSDGGGGGGDGGGGGSDGGGDPGDLATACGGTAPVTLDDWENCYQKRKCEWELGCVSGSTFRDLADCMATSDARQGGKLTAERRARRRAVEQGRASIDVAAFTRCVLRTSRTTCDTALFEPACLTRFTGTIGDGQACYTNIDCASPDAVCRTSCTDACCLGTCQRKFREGETCLEFESCEPELRCATITVPATPPKIIFRCVTGDLGTPCQAGSVNQCDFGSYCDSTTLRCTSALPPGSLCTRLVQCGGETTCVGLSIQDSEPGRCLRVSQPGDTCDSFCFGNLYCDRGSLTCRKLPVLGQSCSALIGCAGANTMCNNGRCVLRSDVGVPCDGPTCLPGLFCTKELGDANPTCDARRPDGAPCAAPGHCQSFLCSGTAAQPGICLPWKNACP